MTEKKRRFHRRITKKNPIKGGAKNFFCRDIVKAYKNKVIYLGVDLNWMDLFTAFSYDLSFAPVTSGSTPDTIKFIIPSDTTAAPIIFDMTKPIDFSKEFSKIDDAIEKHLTLEANNKWNDDNDKTQNSFKYILNNVMLPRYTSNKDIGNGDNNTQIGEISSTFLNWKKESGIVSNTNQIEDEQKNVIVKDKASEKSMMILVHEKLLDFKLKMKKVLINVFKQRVRKNIEIMMDIIGESKTAINIKKTCNFSVSGKIYFGIKVVCNSYTNFELHELIIPDPVIPVMDDLPTQENFPQLRGAVIGKFIKQNEEKIQVHMEDLDGLLMFGSMKPHTDATMGKRGKYGKHNVSFDPHDGVDAKDKNPNYNPELSNIFEILRKH